MSGRLRSGDIIASRYEIKNYLAEGGMQFVYVADDTLTGRRVALKTPKNKSAQKRFERSAIVAAKVNHPNVAKTLDYVSEGDDRYLIEELIAGKDLKEALLKDAPYLDPYMAAKALHHMAKGVAAAHHAHVVHRDLKPSNMMVTGGLSLSELKITDFGIAKMAEEELREAVDGGEQSMTTSQTLVGALPYMAPEGIETPSDVGKAADVWSIGAIMFHLLTGEYPFGSGLRAVPRIIQAARPALPSHLNSNPQFQPLAVEVMTIALACLKKNTAERPTADQLIEMCSNLCYTATERQEGIVKSFLYGSWGFILAGGGREIFFHKDSVYGPLPQPGDRVLFSCYDGGGSPRALPVLKLSRQQK